MARFRDFLKAGHPPTLLSAFLYFNFSFAVWVGGGWISDRIGGINTLSVVFLIVIGGFAGLVLSPSITSTTLVFMLLFAALGAGTEQHFNLSRFAGP